METSSSASVATNCSSSLEDYLNTLTVSCEGDESEAAILTWTPDDNTPDLVYYQVSLVIAVLCILNLLSSISIIPVNHTTLQCCIEKFALSCILNFACSIV